MLQLSHVQDSTIACHSEGPGSPIRCLYLRRGYRITRLVGLAGTYCYGLK